jgi:UDP:flavonoid glycosyltransferase YjiC (YdhE family)
MGPGFNRAVLRLVRLVTRNWSKPVRQLRAELGLPPGGDPIYDAKCAGRLVLAIFSRTFAQPQPDWPANVRVTGFPFYDGEPEKAAVPPELAQFLETGEAPIVFTLGSSAVLDPGKFYEESAAAAALLKRRAVLLMGGNQPVARLPQGVVAFQYVGFSRLFPRAAAVVHQGGIGTTGQALRAGCPMLVMPFNFDQPDNAARVVRLGVGRSITRRHYSAARTAAELNELLSNAAYREQAAKMGAQIQQENGAKQAAKAVEHLLP